MNTAFNAQQETIAAIPRLFGQHLREGIAVLGTRNNILVTAESHGLDDTFALTASAMRRHYIRECILIGYNQDGGLPDAIARAYRQLTDASIDVADFLIVANGQWTGLHEGAHLGQAMPTTGLLAETLAADGYTIGRRIPISPASTAARCEVSKRLSLLAERIDRCQPYASQEARRLINAAGTNAYPDHANTATLIAAAWDVAVATYALTAIQTRQARAQQDLWTWVARHASGPDVAAPAVLAGAAALKCSNGDLASVFIRAAATAAIGWPPALAMITNLARFTTAADGPSLN